MNESTEMSIDKTQVKEIMTYPCDAAVTQNEVDL